MLERRDSTSRQTLTPLNNPAQHIRRRDVRPQRLLAPPAVCGPTLVEVPPNTRIQEVILRLVVERLAERVAPDGEGHEREGEGGEEDVLDVCAVGGAEDEGAEGDVS